jgi:hypothetical protein
VSGINYCIRSPCALGYCVYREQPQDPSLVMAYMFAQMRCCEAKNDWRWFDDFTDAQSAAEYCNRIGYDVTNCPVNKPRYRSFYKVCESDEENGRCTSCKRSSSRYYRLAISHNAIAWCCNAKVHGPPAWWLLLRPRAISRSAEWRASFR